MAKNAFPLDNLKLDALPDPIDFRDKMYVPTLVEVPTHIPLTDYQKLQIPMLSQGREGACTGFGLATVANYLLACRMVDPDHTPVSPRMLYEMAKRHDEWPGEKYSGSTARGAMKGWHKYGVCSEELWKYRANANDGSGLTEVRVSDARRRPLGAYFRVNHRDLVAMHSALAEVGILYASATVHEGWGRVTKAGLIPYPDSPKGGHAFAIVAYDQTGFWIQNSWGVGWGLGGFACITYDDWLANGTDVWVARLGVPIHFQTAASSATAHSAGAEKSRTYTYSDLRSHLVSIGNDGKLKQYGDYGTTPKEIRQIFSQDIPKTLTSWRKKRILLYAHGGLVDEASAVQRLADYRSLFMEQEIYPVAFIWHTGFWDSITNIIQDAIRQRRPEGVLDEAKDFMLDRLDDALEPLVRSLAGKAIWDQIKENAYLASRASKGARLVLEQLAQLVKDNPEIEVHIAGHSAGSIFHAPLVRLLTAQGRISSGYLKGDTGYGIGITSCTLWAPACTIDLFKQAYLPAIQDRTIQRFSLFVLSDKAERDDNCAGVYHKSLLYLVSNALEKNVHIPGVKEKDGTPLLGMEKFVSPDKKFDRVDQDVKEIFSQRHVQLVISPNNEAPGSLMSSGARHHGDFDDDAKTVQATLARILGTRSVDLKGSILDFHHSSSSNRDRRRRIEGLW